jgi:ankyrin repeat protein
LLRLACARGVVGVAKELADAGTEVNAKDSNGMTALQWVAKRKHRDMVALLLVMTNKLKNANTQGFVTSSR